MADPRPEDESPSQRLARLRRLLDEAEEHQPEPDPNPAGVEATPASRPTAQGVARAADDVDRQPGLTGELGRFSGLLTLSPAINLFHRVAVLNYGHLKNGNAFARQKKESMWLFRIAFGIDIALRLIAALLLLAAASVIAWKALFA